METLSAPSREMSYEVNLWKHIITHNNNVYTANNTYLQTRTSAQ